MNKQMNVPNLRFPEFEGAWKSMELRDIICSIDSGWSPQCEENSSNESEWGVLKTTAVTWDGFSENENKRLPDILKPKKQYEVKQNDILITRAGPRNRVGVVVHVDRVREKLIISDKIIRIRTKDSFFEKFTSIALSIDNSQQQLFGKTSGLASSQTNISQEILLSLKLSFPNLQEQIKLTAFFSAIEDKFLILKKQKQHLEQYRNGVLQLVFSQVLRFKDDGDLDFNDWEEMNLGKVLIKNSKKNKNQEFKLVQSVSNKLGFVNQDEYFEDRIIASKNLSNYYVIQRGDFAYNPSRIDVGSLAYKNDDTISVISPLYVSFKGNSNYLNDSFLLSWFSTEFFTKQMNRSFEGSVRNTLSYDSLKRILIYVPSLPEQKKIASFLSALDDKIAQTALQIKKMQLWKNGLLQQMFV